ncbi:MAG: ribonuclease J [Kiloniellales bacterium]
MTDFSEAEALYFLPLGGTGEIGMNLNLYGHDGAWLMVDLGVTFADERQPGVELLMADPAFITERSDDLAGLVLTHAHEDHIGAVPYLWPRLRCPIYATPFTAAVLRGKLAEAGLEQEAEITEVPMSGRFTVGPFELELVTLTHSIPEPNALVIRTSAGTVLHTGDWKLDPDPMLGESYDEAALRALAGEGVLAMVCDSTNALVDGESGSESEVFASLMELLGTLKQRVAVTCFASNVARLQTVMRIAAAHGRRVALVGRGMRRIHQAAVETGYLGGLAPLISEKDVGFLPREEVLILCTGSQGEQRAALWRIARDEHPHIVFEPGDAVIFSSRVIPGNEVGIFELENHLAHKGIRVIGDGHWRTHVSGHPARDELTRMYQWVRPRIAIPVHGEPRHLMEHADLARECQVPQALVAENGSLIRLAGGSAEIVDHVTSGRLALDGSRLIAVDSPVIRERRRLSFSGSALAVLVVDAGGSLLAEPRLTTEGVVDPEHEADVLDQALEVIEGALRNLPKAARRDDERLGEAVRVALRRAFNQLVGKKPSTRVEVLRLP